MVRQPLVSIIIPTYNRAYIIGIAIQSILDQSYDNWELIIIDDGSSDNTKDFVGSFNDARITYAHQTNKGAGAARNCGLTLARGELIGYLDSDNELRPEYIATMVRWFRKYPLAVFGLPRSYRTKELYENGKLVQTIDDSSDLPPTPTVKDIFMWKFHVDTNGFMHHRKTYEAGIQWDETLAALEDWDIAMTLGQHYPKGFLYVPEVLVNYHQRYGGDGIVSRHSYGDWAPIFEQIYQKHKDDELLRGQTWYPDRVHKWQRLQKEFEAGKLPPYYQYYFRTQS